MMNDDVVQGVENELAGCLRYDAIYKMISKVGVDLEVYIEIILQTQSFIFESVLTSPPVYWSVGYMVYHSFLKGLVDTLPCSYRSNIFIQFLIPELSLIWGMKEYTVSSQFFNISTRAF